jgi:hypothetical protein
MISLKLSGIIAVAAFVAGSFVASPELRAFAANTVGSDEIINNSIQSVDIKDGQVKAADIATDAVGAAEIQGVTKMQFAKCVLTDEEGFKVINPDKALGKLCKIVGVTTADQAIGTLNWGNSCFVVSQILPQVGGVSVVIQNTCATPQNPSSGSIISLIVYRK